MYCRYCWLVSQNSTRREPTCSSQATRFETGKRYHYLVELAEALFKNSIFLFKDKSLKQREGTALGTKSAPPYSILFTANLEKEVLSEIECKQ